ncbi:hypothetical protein K2173_027488 [Erythroxylum novogranatense]|uniref:Uncharacterized protein n=1 Tax=Erythroxylum novogranatense TaxID=1862640 RepID=A0AAV8TZ88_9ROSI|nr:hypothetical protein K2173_027488 [Erythroxylum novogranatense]
MADWAPILVGLLLFILLSPGLLFRLPGNARAIEFGSFTTNVKVIVVHTIIFFVVFTILILAMADWGPVIVAVLLFVLLSPGLLFQMPGKHRLVEFGNMETSGASIVVHAAIYFGLIAVFLIAIGPWHRWIHHQYVCFQSNYDYYQFQTSWKASRPSMDDAKLLHHICL